MTKGLVNYITSECQTEIIKKISFYTSNNTYRMNNTIHHISSNISNIQHHKLFYSITNQGSQGKKDNQHQ